MSKPKTGKELYERLHGYPAGELQHGLRRVRGHRSLRPGGLEPTSSGNGGRR